jgi:HAD superfamily hydrolase (TIGR01549 family)
MLETLSLDAGGVLVRPNWPRIANVFQSHGLTIASESLESVELKVQRDLDCPSQIGATNDGERVSLFFSKVLDYAGANGSTQVRGAAIAQLNRIHSEENLWDHVPDDVVPALERFKALGLKLVVLSNANGTISKLFDRLGMSSWFTHIVDSGEEQVEKPDPRFFAIGLKRAGAQKATTLHVGDLFNVDIVGARAAGIRAVLIDRGGLQQDRECENYADLGKLATAIEQGQLKAAP